FTWPCFSLLPFVLVSPAPATTELYTLSLHDALPISCRFVGQLRSASMGTLGVAIVGTGMIGAVHRRAAVLAGAVVRGVAASSPERAREVAQAWGVPRGYGDIEDVIADPQVQVVHVCTPNHLHRPMAQAALEAGKHVVCE